MAQVNGIYNNDALLATTLRSKYSQLTTPAITTAEPPQYVGEPTSVSGGSNLFAGNYEGVNKNLGVGSQISYPTQAGLDRSGFTLCFA